MRPSPNFCAILRIYDYVTPNTVMTALLITQSLEIWCLCINEVVISYTKLGRLHGNVPISWSLQNLFTSCTLSSLFNIIHPSDTPIMQTLQDFISDPTSYIHTTHTIDAFFVKTAYASVVSWIKETTSVLSYVILYNKPFHHDTLWIPHTHLPTSLK